MVVNAGISDGDIARIKLLIPVVKLSIEDNSQLFRFMGVFGYGCAGADAKKTYGLSVIALKFVLGDAGQPEFPGNVIEGTSNRFGDRGRQRPFGEDPRIDRSRLFLTINELDHLVKRRRVRRWFTRDHDAGQLLKVANRLATFRAIVEMSGDRQ